MKNGVIVSKMCGECCDVLDVSNFRIFTNKRVTGDSQRLSTNCNSCKTFADQIRWGKNSRIDFSKSKYNPDAKGSFIEIRIKRIDGVECLTCNSCGEDKSLSEIIRFRGRIYQARCYECQARKGRFRRVLRRCGERFGEDSEEFRELQSTGWKGDFKMVSQMQGLLSGRKIHNSGSPKVQLQMRRLFYRLSENVEQKKGGGDNKGQGGNSQV